MAEFSPAWQRYQIFKISNYPKVIKIKSDTEFLTRTWILPENWSVTNSIDDKQKEVWSKVYNGYKPDAVGIVIHNEFHPPTWDLQMDSSSLSIYSE